MSKSYDVLVKFIIIGDSNVGKTSIANSLMESLVLNLNLL